MLEKLQQQQFQIFSNDMAWKNKMKFKNIDSICVYVSMNIKKDMHI